MQTIKNVALVLCGILVATSFASFLLPDSKYKKLISYVISLVIVLSVVGVFSKADFEIEVPTAATNNTQSLENMTAQQAQYIIEAYLSENGIKVKKVLCYMDILDDGDIVINKVCVYTAKDAAVVKQLLVEGFGIQEVYVYEE